MSSNTYTIPEKILVELHSPVLDFRTDTLLPSRMPISSIRKGLLKLLRAKERRFFKTTDIVIYYKGNRLQDEATLASLGIWDGSILELAVTTKSALDSFNHYL